MATVDVTHSISGCGFLSTVDADQHGQPIRLPVPCENPSGCPDPDDETYTW
jgi:hypothetical protein